MLPKSKAKQTYKATVTQRGMFSRAKPVFWLAAALGIAVACLVTYGLSRSAFRTRSAPLPAPSSAAALLPTHIPPTQALPPTPRPLASSIPDLVWTFEMTPLTNGQFMVPDTVRAQMQAAWVQSLSMLDALPWESVTLDAAFTGSALDNGKQMLADRDQPPSGALTKTVPGGRVFSVVGCDRSGATCTVTEVFGQVSLDVYDYSTRAKRGTVQLDRNLLYLFSGTMVWTGDRWRVAVLNEPMTTQIQQ